MLSTQLITQIIDGAMTFPQINTNFNLVKAILTELLALGETVTAVAPVSEEPPIDPGDGYFWFSPDGLKIYSEADEQWIPAIPEQEASIFVQEADPNAALAPQTVPLNTIWYSTADNGGRFYIWDGEAWKGDHDSAGGNGGGATVIIQDEEPEGEPDGSFWFDPNAPAPGGGNGGATIGEFLNLPLLDADPEPPVDDSFNLFMRDSKFWVQDKFGSIFPIFTIPTTLEDLVYESNGDDEGLFYWLGTNRRTAAWTNPITLNKVVISSSSGLQFGDITQITDRQPGEVATGNVADSFYKFDFGVSAIVFAVKTWSFRSRSADATSTPTGMVLEGSNDNVNWTNIDTRIGLNFVAASQWMTFDLESPSPAFRYIRLRQHIPNNSNANNYFIIGELELYGKVVQA